jgi:hypothetical protein
VHFPEDPPGGARARALREEMQAWQPGRGPNWADLMSRAAGARRQRFVVSVTAASAAVLAFVVALAAFGAAHALPPGLETLRERLIP